MDDPSMPYLKSMIEGQKELILTQEKIIKTKD